MSETTDQYGPWHHVRVGASGRDETVRGHDRDEALANAEHTWPWQDIEYVGVDDAFAEPIDRIVCRAEPYDWWGSDYPDTGQQPCIQHSEDVQEHVR